jgi:hypothetical protein
MEACIPSASQSIIARLNQWIGADRRLAGARLSAA